MLNRRHFAVEAARAVVGTAGTAVQLPDQKCGMVIITAELDNSNPIFVGGSGVMAASSGTAQAGFALYGGQTSPPLYVYNTNLIWIDAITNGDGIAYAYFD